jgi:hypothetical protein
MEIEIGVMLLKSKNVFGYLKVKRARILLLKVSWS